MATRKEEERNEKIIRGLMKLPPNRKCINCNSLGPQYVCTNFWTFVCMTCSGIHREFTHRVKSVSMAKFTSQEVDSLQNAGNQRAREIYLKNWDFQRQRLPDSSNVDKIREFIRHVYVDRRYAATKSSDKPPRDMQNPRINEDDTRRASSYHSYSQSPPYDYQYEDRRYGKQAAALTRKPGSDKVRYEGKMSSIIYSPGRFSDHAYEDRFANEGSGPRISDFSVSSGGEQFKSEVQSPNFHKDIGFHSPPYRHSGHHSSEDVWAFARNTSLETNAKRDMEGIRLPQRTASLGSMDSNLSSFRSHNSGGLVDFFSEPVQAFEPLQTKVSCVPQPPGPAGSTSSDISNTPVAAEPSIDLFQLPGAPSQSTSVDLFQSAVLSAVPYSNESQPTQTSQPSSVDFFANLSQQPSTATSDEKSLELSAPKNEGWATFDMPQYTASTAKVETPAVLPSAADTLQDRFDPFLNLNGNMQWPSFETSGVSVPSSVTSNVWHDGAWNGEEQVSVTATSTQPWSAFEDSVTPASADGLNQGLQLQNLPSTDDQCLDLRASEGCNEGGMQGIAPIGGFDDHEISSNFSGGSAYPPSAIPPMGESQPNGNSHKSTNPFDFLDDADVSDVEHSNMFLDLSSLQAALPDAQLQPTFHSGIAEPWLPQNSVNSYISSAGQGGGLTFLAAQPPSSQISNIQTQEPVASFGGNPFA
ncbi:probable ADP-ribosylation factor GTPase-activating protein AGD14 isoform X2 [Arachis hypogaea]|uniref:probable ADP-ribosylation factor GTPase-activating protein AGD14 isoform X2 n=2 Tax=Arachis hypogaea TaxID=3818 RepID=UPI000DECB7D4|nr:probable ADP-ribosylation factor GTPase-activating protein AGD14 isoform X2 [Arachis hypogaea]QHO46815.1 putative ADP-ribosylation factor GTPase-activating protein [Arachis hypogaea]